MKFTVFTVLLVLVSCTSKPEYGIVHETNSLKIEQLSDHVYRHVSYLQTDGFGKVACNGMLLISDGKALIFDTPATNEVSKELIDWVETTQKSEVTGVVINHFHDDCLGGLEVFHKKKIVSYANQMTIDLLQEKNAAVIPEIGFRNTHEIQLGEKRSINRYFGPGHTKDNIISYIPDEEIVFGGCMIKSLKAGKGYTGAADVEEWPKTVEKIKQTYPQVKVVIPGHGKAGGSELLDYTIELFEE